MLAEVAERNFVSKCGICPLCDVSRTFIYFKITGFNMAVSCQEGGEEVEALKTLDVF